MAEFAGWQLFQDRWRLAQSAESDQRTNELADLAFESGDHWDAAVKKDRERDGKPCLTIDLLSGPIKQVTNQQRTARPGIKIAPVGTGDSKKAEVWQGLLRRTERLSQADRRAYPWAGQHQVKMGRGFWVIRNQYIGESDEQDIRIEEVDNQHTVYVDPTTKKLDGSDKKWAIRFEDLTHDEYKARFGESKLADTLGKAFQGQGAAMPEWITTTATRIAEYYYLKPTTRTKVFLDDAREDAAEPMDTAYEDELERHPSKRGTKGQFEKGDYKLPEGVSVRTSRKVTTHEVRWCLLNGMGEELDSARIPGTYIPVVKIYGERRNINGKVDERGMVRMAKDPSRMEDFCESSLMEAIADAKTAPWLAEYTQLEGLEHIWNGKTPKVLPYHRQSGANGAPLPPPQKVSSGIDVTAITLAAQRMQNHVRSVTGQHDTFQEESGSVQGKLSGRAIDKRRQIQELGTSDFMEGLGDGIVLTARIIIAMAREVWDTPRVMRITDKAEKERPIVIHQGQDQQQAAQQLGQQHGVKDDDIYDLGDEDPESYDIAIAPGRNFDTQRQETVETLGSLIPNLPPPMQVRAIPVLIKNMDGPGMQELAAALEPETQDGIPPQIAQRMQEMEQQLQQAAEYVRTEQAKHQATIQIKQAEYAAKVQLEQVSSQMQVQLQQMKHAADIEIAKINLMGKGIVLERQADLEAQATGQEMAHTARQGAADRYHEREMADQAHQRALELGAQQAVHGTMAADQSHQQGLEAGEVQHAQSLEAGDVGHQQALEQQKQQAKLAPKPAKGKQ